MKQDHPISPEGPLYICDLVPGDAYKSISLVTLNSDDGWIRLLIHRNDEGYSYLATNTRDGSTEYRSYNRLIMNRNNPYKKIF